MPNILIKHFRSPISALGAPIIQTTHFANTVTAQGMTVIGYIRKPDLAITSTTNPKLLGHDYQSIIVERGMIECLNN